MNRSKSQNSHLVQQVETVYRGLLDDPEAASKILNLLKLANMGKVMGSVAHTFNNILGGILGYAQLLKGELKPRSESFRQAEIIEMAARRASKLVSQLQLYVQPHTGSHTYLDPKVVLDEVVVLARSSFGKAIRISASCEHANARIIGDFAALSHVLLNLCSNAREAMPEGGELDLKTTLADLPANGSAEAPTQRVVFEVADTGGGMAPETLARAFEPFFTTRSQDMATGLGLTIARSIAQDHGGNIDLESKIGQGTKARLWLPAANTAELRLPEPAGGKRPHVQGNGELIMVVDDEVDLCLMARKILERKGYEVLVADTAAGAIRCLQERGSEIQLIVLDLCMPGEDGVKVFEELKRGHHTAKLILTSGYTYNSPYQDLIDASGAPFLPKPWDMTRLLEETQRLLAQVEDSRAA